jgi:hypothetical protein
MATVTNQVFTLTCGSGETVASITFDDVTLLVDHVTVVNNGSTPATLEIIGPLNVRLTQTFQPGANSVFSLVGTGVVLQLDVQGNLQFPVGWQIGGFC